MENYTNMMENEYQGGVVDFGATGLGQALAAAPNNPPNDVVSLQPPPEMKEPSGEVFDQASMTIAGNLQDELAAELAPALEAQQENCQPTAIEAINENPPEEVPPPTSSPKTDAVDVIAEVDIPDLNSTVEEEGEEGAKNSADATQEEQEEPADDPIEATPEDSSKTPEATPEESARKKEEEVDPQQCRVCTSKENLVDIFSPFEDSVISEKIQIICRTVKILERDFLPHFICSACVDKLKIALEFKETCENTDREMRKKLKRSKKTVRRNTEFVLIDADAFSESNSEDEKKRTDDEEFKLSDVVESSASDTDSTFHSEEQEKKYKGKRGRPRGSTNRGRRRSRNDVVFIAAPMSDGEDNSDTKKKFKGKTLHCQTCNEVFASPASLAKHPCAQNDSPLESVVKNEQSSDEDEEDKPLAKRRKTKDSGHQCKFCRLTFRTMGELKNHKAQQHRGEKPYLCRLCNKSFKLAQSLNGHLQRHENEESQVTCQHCWKYFPNKKELRKHEATAHAVAFTCDRCKRNFTSQTRLNNHRQLTCPGVVQAPKKRQEVEASVVGRDLFKCVAPMTTTYWSDSFSE